MKKVFFASIVFFAFCSSGVAQTSRKSIGAAEANGTYRQCFTGKFKGTCSEINILALGKGKLRVSFDLVFPHLDAENQPTANVGFADGEAAISGDTAIYTKDECKITIQFVKPGRIKVEQNDDACGFGYNVWADGAYKKTSSAKPKFNAR